MFRGIPHTEIDSVWPEIMPWIAESCRRGGDKYWPSDILRYLNSRDMQLWVAGNDKITAIAITEIIKYPRKTCLRIHLGGGDYKKYFKEFIKTSENWARENSCTAGEAITRPAWCSAFRALGWRKTQIYVERDL